MALDTYDTHTLNGVIQTLPPPPSSYWLDFFPNVQLFDSEWIDFDEVTGTRRMAPFVAPTAVGKPIMALGFNVKRFKPAYIKPKSIIDPQRMVKRRAGEPFMGTLSLSARRDAVVASELEEHKNQIYRRWEWMACEAVVKGKVTVVGEDYPSTLVDFQRVSTHTITLSGAALWTDALSDPIQDIEDWTIAFHLKSGVPVTRITMGLTAWRAYRKHAKVLAQANLLLRGTTDSVNIGAVTGAIAQRVATVGNANIEIYLYNDIYEDNAGASVPFLDQTTVVLTSQGMQGVRCFGAILDGRAGYRSIDMFSKSWEQEDPSVEYVMTQSAPLMVPAKPNASMAIKVVA